MKGIIILTMVATISAGGGTGNYPRLDHPWIGNFLSIGSQDTLVASDTTHRSPFGPASADYRYPGKAMTWSLVLPGTGQLYVKKPVKTAIFIGAEVASLILWRVYTDKGVEAEQTYKNYANDHWDFRDWVLLSESTAHQEWESLGVGVAGTHSVKFIYDDPGDEFPPFYGNTNDHADSLESLLINPFTSNFVTPIKSHEFYENVGKYNQFFAGWDDAESDFYLEVNKSGDLAMSPHKQKYLAMRREANQLLSFSSYAISALLFNHIVSAVDAVFSASQSNKERSVEVGGRLWYDPSQTASVGGATLSLSW